MPSTLFFIISLFFIFGTFAPLNKIFLLSLGLPVLFYLYNIHINSHTNWHNLKLFALALLAFCAGYFYFLWRTSTFSLSQFDFRPSESVNIEVVSEPTIYETYQRFTGKINNTKILVYAPNLYQIQFGDMLKTEGEISRLEDKEHQLNQIYFKLSVKNLSKVGKKKSLLRQIFVFKKQLETKLAQSLSPNSFEIIAGILWGRDIQSPELKASFKKAGLSHLTAMSGYNLTLISSGAYNALRYLPLSRLALTSLSISFLSLFVIFAGAQGSIVRAFIMSLVLILIRNQGRVPLSRNILLSAALLVTLFNPTTLAFDLGFQLSFLATVGIIYLAPRIEEKMQLWFSGRKNFLKKTAAETIGAQLLVLPLIWYYFGELNLFSFFANLIVLPLIQFLMLLGLLTFLSLALPLLPIIIAYPYELFSLLIKLLGNVPMFYFNPPLTFIVAIYIGLAYWLYQLNKNALLDCHFAFR